MIRTNSPTSTPKRQRQTPQISGPPPQSASTITKKIMTNLSSLQQRPQSEATGPKLIKLNTTTPTRKSTVSAILSPPIPKLQYSPAHRGISPHTRRIPKNNRTPRHTQENLNGNNVLSVVWCF
jgi:hypothetical protein